MLNRRTFIKGSLITLAGLSTFSWVRYALAGKPKADPVPAGMTEVPATDPVAQAIGYKADVKDLDYAKYPQRKKPDAKNQFCNNCALYTKVNESWGKCQMITPGVVAAKGWCGSYSKKT